jgi:hypothetical protein
MKQMGNFVPLPTPTTTTIPPPTTLKPSAPSAAENLVPRIAEGPSVSFSFYFIFNFIFGGVSAGGFEISFPCINFVL